MSLSEFIKTAQILNADPVQVLDEAIRNNEEKKSPQMEPTGEKTK